jgi:hypothetical protein
MQPGAAPASGAGADDELVLKRVLHRVPAFAPAGGNAVAQEGYPAAGGAKKRAHKRPLFYMQYSGMPCYGARKTL